MSEDILVLANRTALSVQDASNQFVFPPNRNLSKKKGAKMMESKLNMAELMLIAGTRIVLGAGIGLLLSTRMNNDQRKAAGLSLALVGGFTTIPLVMGVMGKKSERAELRTAA